LAESSFREVSSKAESDTAAPQYFAEFYSYEGKFGLPANSHTFGRFVKVVNGKVTEKIDISWLPKDEFLRHGGRMPLFSSVPGKNRSFEETQVLAGKKPIKNHGRFEIDEEIFQKAVTQKNKLESGNIEYKFLASASSDQGINCIHALLGVVGQIPTGSKSGAEATQAVIKYFIDKKAIKPVNTPNASFEPVQAASLSFSRSAQSYLAESQKNISNQNDRETHSSTNNIKGLLPKVRAIFSK